MVLINRDPELYAPTGSFVESITGTEGSASAEYDRGTGTYRDVTQVGATISWTYIPGRISDEDTVTLTQDVPGSHQTALVSNGKAAREFRNSLVVTGGESHPHLVGFTPGSYAEFSWDTLKAKIDAPGVAKRLVSGSTYPASCWASGYDWSGVARWNSQSRAATRRGVAITRRHLWLAKHWRYPVGTIVRFLTPAGVTVERTVTGVAYYGELSDTTQDVYIATLSADLPPEIADYPVAGTWIRDTETVAAGESLLMFGAFMYVDQNEDVQLAPEHSNGLNGIIVDVAKFGSARVYDYCEPSVVEQYAPLFSGYESWMKIPIGGDSGSPVFVPLSDTEMAVLTVLTGSYGGEGPDEDDLNDLIAAADLNAGISTGYTVTVAPDPTA